MIRASVGMVLTLPRHLLPDLRSWLSRGKGWLYPYRPRFKDWRFWAVQGFILVIAGTHSTAEILKMLGHPIFLGSEPRVALASFVTVSLFFVPVVYAALNFGRAGSVATAVWCSLLTVPNLVVFHEGMERVREALQIGVVDAIAVFVGQRVEREMTVRHRAETAGTALQASETKYRGLFESTPLAILVVDPSGAVLEANPSAGALFGKAPASLKGMNVAGLVGPRVAVRLLDASDGKIGQDAYITLKVGSPSEVYLEPTLTSIIDSDGKPAIQVLLRDVTEERQRQAGLRTYAAHVLRAQEEERKRIAHELHDGTVQALVLLCRRLDAVEGAGGSMPTSVIEGLQEARKAAEEVAQELRDFARTLRPPTLDDLGLTTSIRRLLVDLAERAHLEPRLKVVGEENRLPPDIELGVFRIAQEALRNVERHAKAHQTAVTLAFTPREVRLEVVDDGVGFVPSFGRGDFASKGKLGLLGMRERAELLGGRLEIHSSPGKGTRVALSIPLEQ